MMTLNNLSSSRGSHKNIKRIGRGQGSGYGTQAGKGHKGQKARSGSGIRQGFEGGAMPLYKRLPKRGFKNAPFKVEYTIVDLARIDAHYQNEEINRETLILKGILKGSNKRKKIKILGSGTLSRPFIFSNIDKFSVSAHDMIKKIGGTIKNLK